MSKTGSYVSRKHSFEQPYTHTLKSTCFRGLSVELCFPVINWILSIFIIVGERASQHFKMLNAILNASNSNIIFLLSTRLQLCCLCCLGMVVFVEKCELFRPYCSLTAQRRVPTFGSQRAHSVLVNLITELRFGSGMASRGQAERA